jgi:hypothetical protein
VIVGALFLFLPALILRVRREYVKPVYLCGENVDFQTKWHGLADMEFNLATGGFYFEKSLAEERMNIWAILFSAVALIFSLAMGIVAMWPNK